MSEVANTKLQEWNTKSELAEQILPGVGRLFRNNDVLLTIYGRSLLNKSTIGIVKAHRYARHFDGKDLDLNETLAIVNELQKLNLTGARLDLGRLAAGYREAGGDLGEYLKNELSTVIDGEESPEPRDVVLYGFGRIGRLVARILVDRNGGTGMRLRAIVVRKNGENDIIKRASLLRRDSVHGKFDGSITVDEENNTILANGVLIQVIYSSDPSSVD